MEQTVTFSLSLCVKRCGFPFALFISFSFSFCIQFLCLKYVSLLFFRTGILPSHVVLTADGKERCPSVVKSFLFIISFHGRFEIIYLRKISASVLKRVGWKMSIVRQPLIIKVMSVSHKTAIFEWIIIQKQTVT